MSVEVIALLSVVAVLLYPQSFLLAAGVYLGFQLALIFGNYLVRLETLVIAKESFKPVDIGKTLGALTGALAHSAVDFGLTVPANAFCLAIFLGLACGTVTGRSPGQSRRSRTAPG